MYKLLPLKQGAITNFIRLAQNLKTITYSTFNTLRYTTWYGEEYGKLTVVHDFTSVL